MIEMPVRPTLGIMSIGHNISVARLLTPLGVGTIVTGKTMGISDWMIFVLVGLVWLWCCRGI